MNNFREFKIFWGLNVLGAPLLGCSFELLLKYAYQILIIILIILIIIIIIIIITGLQCAGILQNRPSRNIKVKNQYKLM